MGVSPDDTIKAVLGPEWFQHLIYVRERVLGMNAEQARWMLVIVGDFFFAVSLYYLFFVYFANKMDRLYVTVGEMEDAMGKMKKEFDDDQDKLTNRVSEQEKKVDQAKNIIDKKISEVKQREKAIRKIHDQTHLLLQKVRKEKTEKP